MMGDNREMERNIKVVHYVLMYYTADFRFMPPMRNKKVLFRHIKYKHKGIPTN